MATLRDVKAQKPVGSLAWIEAEKENVSHLMVQEMEEIEYPVRYEMDWLNEHMAEVFGGNQFNVTEIFKTPAKMRGKTPRTIKKHATPSHARIPLSDIFSSEQNIRHSPIPPTKFNNEIANLASPLPKNDASKDLQPSQSQNSNPYYNTDSGYHGMPDEDQMKMIDATDGPDPETATLPLEESTIMARDGNHQTSFLDRRTTESSFHSARETAPSKEATAEPMEVDEFQYQIAPQKLSSPSIKKSPSPMKAVTETQRTLQPVNVEKDNDRDQNDAGLDNRFDDIGSPSEGSTPDRPPIRKSSLTFASLPAREPLNTKKSMGARMSRTSHVDKITGTGQSAFFGRQTGGARLTQMLPENNANTDPDSKETKANLSKERIHGEDESDVDRKASKLHSKSSTQLLHEKINMLGKSQPSRGTKSITPAAPLATSQISYPELAPKSDSYQDNGPGSQIGGDDKHVHSKSPPGSPSMREPKDSPARFEQGTESSNRNIDIGISRLRSGSPDRRSPGSNAVNYGSSFGHNKVASTSVLSSPKQIAGSQLQRANTVSSPMRESTTPQTSPKRYDGPLGASKSRLQSIMKSAKGLFSSSAGVSAAARMETHSPSASRPQNNLYPNLYAKLAQVESQESKSETATREEGRRTRSSIEKEKQKEKEAIEKQHAEEQLERNREQDKNKGPLATSNEETKPQALNIIPPKAAIPANRASPPKQQQQQPTREAEPVKEERKPTIPSIPQPNKQNENRRPVKPTRDTQKQKPQPVSIRVGTLSQRIPLSGSTLSSGTQEPAPNPAPAAKPTVTKKPSTSSLHTTNSANSLKSSTSSASSKSRATTAAEKKREQEQRDTQRKLEQRREAERKRVAQQEEARRQEQANRAEAERRERERSVVDDSKKQAQKQAIERRRLENARKLEQQRSQQSTPSGDLNSSLIQEKPGLAGSQRNDFGHSKSSSRMNSVQPPSRPISRPQNAAKPQKRPVEEDSVTRPASTKPNVIHQADGKRRKTEDEFTEPPPVRPTMAPPIRQSNVRKELPKQQFLGHGYSAVQQQPQSQPGQPLFKNPSGATRHFQPSGSMQGNRVGHPLEMAKYASGKIPFAEASNHPQPIQKTPAQPPQRIPKSSPNYPNGENIKLPEIPTDSEDSDSEAETYNVPEWAKEENLARILLEQDGQDGEQVFGPSAPLHMEEIFKDNKDRIRKFRDRTSSANWAGPDGLTQEEVRWDLAARERLKNNGGWTFGL